MESSNDNEHYEIERIVDRRVRNGGVEYYLKWKGYSAAENTWEPYSHLNAEKLVSKFEKNRKGKKRVTFKLPYNGKNENVVGSTGITSTIIKPEILTSSHKKVKPKRSNIYKKMGFDRGLKAEKIIGASETNCELYFLVKWKECVMVDLVPAKLANIKCPQVVIKYYQERLTLPCNESN